MLQFRFVRFVLVGVLNTLFSYCIYSFFLFVGVHYAAAALLASVLGALFNFKTIGTLVFRSRDNSLIVRFLAVYAFTYFLNVGALRLCALHHANMYLAGFLLALPMAGVSFLLQSRFVFAKKNVAVAPVGDGSIPLH